MIAGTNMDAASTSDTVMSITTRVEWNSTPDGVSTVPPCEASKNARRASYGIEGG